MCKPRLTMSSAKSVRSKSRSPLSAARRVVVKVGSALLVDQRTGRLNRAWLESLVEDLLRLRRRGQQVILVSSGAIALGRRHLGLPAGALRLEESQAAAAVGQIRLAHAYKELLEAHDVTVAQVLLTLEDSEQRTPLPERARDARRAAGARRHPGDQRERHGGDRGDPLRRQRPAGGARGADDQRGLPGAAVGRRRPVHRRSQSGSRRALHRPGARRSPPRSRPWPARSASRWGPAAWRPRSPRRASPWAPAATCASRRGHPHPLRRIESGARCTWFMPASTPVAARKQWIAGTLRPAGALHIDAGATARTAGRQEPAARRRHRHLRTLRPRRHRQRAIDETGREVARGIAGYSDADAARIIGRRSGEIESLLGYRGREELIHRDDLVILRHD
jgi:glutamate 5-kinase